MMNWRIALLGLAAALAVTPAAMADSFKFYFSGPGGVSGSGTLFATSEGAGKWLVTSGTGTFNDGSVSGSISLIANPYGIANSALSPSGSLAYDDLLYTDLGPGQVLTPDGLLFSFDGMDLNLWEGGFPFADGWNESDGAGGEGEFILTPEPGSLLLLGTGLLGLAAVLFRKRKLFSQLSNA